MSEFESKVLAARDRIMARPGPKKSKTIAFRVPIRRPRRSGMVTGCPQTHPWMIHRLKRENVDGNFVGVLSRY